MKKTILIAFLAMLPFIKNNIKTEAYYVPSVKYSANENNSNNYLSSVTFDGLSFNFNKEKLVYEINVPYSKSTLGLSYVAEDSRAIVEVIGNDELHVGNNSLVIIVTSVDGSLREYDFTINRSEDNSGVANNSEDLLNGLKNNDSSQVTVFVGSDEGISLSGDILNVLKNNKKILVYEWNDQNGNFVASLKIDGSKIKNDNPINPNIKKSISNAKLLEYIKDTNYIAISTEGTNIPKNSIYTMSVSGSDDIYYLYYYEGDLLNTKPLRNIDGKIEFEIEGGYDYAIVGESVKPSKVVNGFSWIVPSIIATIVIATFIIISRKIMLNSLKNSYSESNREENNEQKNIE